MRDLFGGDVLSGPTGTFHTRNAMPAADVARGRRAAATQEAILLAWFEAHPGIELTPFEVQEQVPGLSACPVTSVRRALTNLTKAGHLEKMTERQRKGRYGMHNCVWRLRP